MPDRNRPGSRWYVAAHIVLVACGLAGLTLEPSASVAATLAVYGLPWAVFLWSGILTLAGAAAVLSRLRAWYFAEAAAVDAVAGVFILWSGMVLVMGGASSLQAGLAFLAVALFLHGWAKYRRERLEDNVRTLRAVAARTVELEAASAAEDGLEVDEDERERGAW